MKKIIITLVTILGMLFLNVSNASEQAKNKIGNQLDRIEGKVDKVVDVVATDHFRNKTIGLEFNPVRLIAWNSEAKTVSGSVSFFNIFDNAELAFPIYFEKSNDEYDTERGDFTLATIDMHYRNFLSSAKKGFYLAGFSRLAYLNGILGDDYDYFGLENRSNKYGSELKLGIGFGVGYRIFSKSGWYWGASLSVGRYFIGENDKFVGNLIGYDDDAEMIFDVEFLKFGYAF